MQFFLIMYLCLAASFTNVNATEADCSSLDNSSISNYITVNFDQIYLTNDGMFVHIDREYIPIHALYSNGSNQYKCHLDFHERLHDIITCPFCFTVYDRHEYRTCPNIFCPRKH